MRVTISFVDLLQRMVLVFTHHRRLLWFGLPFGIIAALSAQVSERLSILSPENSTNWSLLLEKLEQGDLFLLGGVVSLVVLGLTHSLIRGPFFLAFEQAQGLRSPTNSTGRPIEYSKIPRRAALTSLTYEGGYWFILAILTAIISLPIFLAFRFNPTVAPVISELGLLLFFTVAILFFFLKEFALLYALLAHTKIKDSLELSLHLFKKHLFLTLLFHFFLLILSLLFTFPANLAIIANDFIGVSWEREGLVMIVWGIVFGASILVKESLKLLFFHALAATPQVKIPKVKEMIEEKNPGSAPTA